MELTKLSQGKCIAGASADRERAKALMLVYSPDKKSNTLATGVNLIDIEASFQNGGRDREEDVVEAEAERLLHGTQKNLYG